MEQYFIIIWCLLVICVFVVTLFSHLPGRSWVLRVCDFPRAQVLSIGLVLIAVLIMAMLIGFPFEPQGGAITWAFATLLVVSVILQGLWAIQFTPLRPVTVRRASLSPESMNETGQAFRLVTANVDFENSDPSKAMRMLMDQDPDLLAMVETDDTWDEIIEGYRSQYPYIVKELREKGRGVAVLSRLQIEHSEIKYLVDQDRPSIWMRVCLPGTGCVRVIITHPAPPGLPKRNGQGRHSSKKRDIELDLIASYIGDRPNDHWILAGDFNDVGWSWTTLKAKQVSGLSDPRIGRGMYNTFPAAYPFLRYPIDHVLVSDAFELVELRRIESIGSDHLPLLADLVLAR
jgi:endonuclease/exonuclease/phosphatase (EEP) superfamily protein YafD